MNLRICSAIAVLLTLTAAPTHAIKPARPTSMPIARLLKNVDAFVKAHPNDPDGYYVLGRIHYFAFAAPRAEPKEKPWAKQPDALLVYGADGLPSFFENADTPGKSQQPRPSSYRRTPEQQIAHVRAAVTNLAKALQLRGDRPGPSKDYAYSSSPGLYELCLACALEDGAAYAAKVGAIPGVVATGKPIDWREEAIGAYRLAYERAIEVNLKTEWRDGPLVAEEAGSSYKRLVVARGATVGERRFLTKVEQKIAQLKRVPREITPIVFALESQPSLAGLLDPAATVSFDLDGSGRAQRVSWVKPDTAILCWDPEGTGKIVSGRQLFGNVTWWMFWQDGYRALDALDDNRDGWLRDAELSGLALWFDRNQNGISDAGEVVPIERTAVAGIATRSDGREGISPRNGAGLLLRDGRRLPTWDWVAEVR